MGSITYRSDSEEYLLGVRDGINHVNDSAIEAKDVEPSPSDISGKYAYSLLVVDEDSDEDVVSYHNGASFDYQE